MCVPTYCSNPYCARTTWWGCGLHIPSVMDRLALKDQCDCEEHTPLPPGVEPDRLLDPTPRNGKFKPRWPKRRAVGGGAA
ncbi:hypothetical protein BCR35DRAFT_308857 [Leucosporidium creatinivorum]|uniref:Uncharacterized protein n=1 Tax=Leucosporidium creatinivorum TaxID=106004 RepID=A0A1Y2DWP1_9BASI|nr:hypothetical protein BCR35DRAFT_308857 [Leucosporidium creatinivorum]